MQVCGLFLFAQRYSLSLSTSGVTSSRTLKKERNRKCEKIFLFPFQAPQHSTFFSYLCCACCPQEGRTHFRFACHVTIPLSSVTKWLHITSLQIETASENSYLCLHLLFQSFLIQPFQIVQLKFDLLSMCGNATANTLKQTATPIFNDDLIAQP